MISLKKINKLYTILKYKVFKNTIIDRNTQIGKQCSVGYGCIITKTTIGNYCSIANYVLIGGGEHDISRISLNSMFYENPWETLTKGDVIIGNDVWIGNGVIIRRGVKIGNGAVIGANSFVNKDIPPYSIAVGSPARIIKYRFKDKEIQAIEESERWNYNPKEAGFILSSLGKRSM